jgi:antitoxin ParD1/3/4
MMPKSTSVILDEHLVGFIERQIAAGRYGSASEVVRAAGVPGGARGEARDAAKRADRGRVERALEDLRF